MLFSKDVLPKKATKIFSKNILQFCTSFWSVFWLSKEPFFAIWNIGKVFFLVYFALKQTMKIFPILDQSHRLTPLGQNSSFATFPLNVRKYGIFQIFDQNHGLTRLEKFEFFDFSLSLIIVYKVLFST